MTKRNKAMVNLCADAMAAKESVQLKGEVECGASCGQHLYLSFRRKHENLGCNEVQFDGIEKVHRIGLRVV